MIIWWVNFYRTPDAGTVVQLNGYSDLKCLALAVTSDGNIDQLGDGDDGDLSVQDDAEIMVLKIRIGRKPFHHIIYMI